MSESESEDQSRYEPLELPEHHSSVPEDLLHGLSKKDRRITNSLSVIEQQNAWIIARIVSASKIHRDLDIRISRLERWQHSLSQRLVKVLATTVIAPLVVSAISYYVLRHFKP